MSKKNKEKRAKLIVNPGAGDAMEKSEKLEQVVRCLEESGIQVSVAFSHPKEEAGPIAKQAVKDGYKIVIAMGGDGTIVEVMRGVASTKARLGIIVGGTMNDIAASLGIPEDVEAACALITSGKARKIDLGQVKTKSRKKFYFFMVTAIGLTATIYPKVKKIPKGKLTGLKDAVSTFLKFDPKPKVYLTLDNESKIKVKTMLVTIANTPLIASKNLVAPDASMQDGLLDISVFPEFSKVEVLSYFAKSSKETVIPDGKLQRYRARKVKVKSSPKLEIAADGIPLGKGKATIRICPKALRIFAPAVGSGAEKPPEDVPLAEPFSPFISENG